MEIKISGFDVSEYLDDEETIASYLSSIIEEGDPQLLLAAISDVAKARGMAKIVLVSGFGNCLCFFTGQGWWDWAHVL